MEVFMNGINSYNAYLNNQYNTTTSKSQKTGYNKSSYNNKVQVASNDNDEVKLSDKAKDLLKELRQKYGNIDFMVASYNTDEEADSYLSRGTKEFSVLIDPEELEKMAGDEDRKNKNIGIIEEATGTLSTMKEKLGDKKDEVKNIGISIGKDGSVSYFASLEKLSEKQKERIESQKEDKGGYIQSPRIKKARVTAASAEELLDKINNVDWTKIKEEKPGPEQNKFNYSI